MIVKRIHRKYKYSFPIGHKFNCEGSDKMKKIKFGLGGLLMIAAMLISDSLRILGIYILAAILHELGHLFAAKSMKIEIKEIKFGFSGVRIVTDERLNSYKNEVMLAAAGPIVNIMIFLSVFAYFCLNGGGMGLFDIAEVFLSKSEFTTDGALGFLALSSLIQAIFNLMPVNTFDGGRILYCLIAQIVNEHVADHVLSVTTAFSAFILWTVALYLMLKVAAGLGIYVFAACIFASMIGKEKNI